MLPTILGFAALEGVAGLAFADAPTLGTTLILVAYAALIWMARSLARRARMGAAVVVTCAGLLAASIGVVLLQPSLYPTLTIVPLLVVAVALPYVGGRRLIRLLVGCWLVTILVAVLGQTLTDQAAIPAWFAGLFYTSALAAASAMVLLLLWQFSDRLSEALGRLEAQRERLHVTLHSIGDGVIATDTAGTVTLLNPIAEALTGWPRDEAVGRPFGEVFPIISEVTRAPAVDPIATVLSTGARVGLANHTVPGGARRRRAQHRRQRRAHPRPRQPAPRRGRRLPRRDRASARRARPAPLGRGGRGAGRDRWRPRSSRNA